MLPKMLPLNHAAFSLGHPSSPAECGICDMVAWQFITNAGCNGSSSRHGGNLSNSLIRKDLESDEIAASVITIALCFFSIHSLPF